MRPPLLFLLLLLSGLAGMVTGCGRPASTAETLFQTSTIDALLTGVFEGDLTVGELLQQGNHGLGTFDALDGEMVVLDGTCYQVKSDGRVYRPTSEMRTPFASVCRFAPDSSFRVETPADAARVQAMLDAHAPNPNIFYGIKITGRFARVHTRSVARQTKPYPPLKEATARQPEFRINETEGTIVGFRCPAYVKGISVPGYHLHFITKDRTAGGHVLDYEIGGGVCQVDAISRYTLRLPEGTESFARSDLTADRSAELDGVEKAKKP